MPEYDDEIGVASGLPVVTDQNFWTDLTPDDRDTFLDEVNARLQSSDYAERARQYLADNTAIATALESHPWPHDLEAAWIDELPYDDSHFVWWGSAARSKYLEHVHAHVTIMNVDIRTRAGALLRDNPQLEFAHRVAYSYTLPHETNSWQAPAPHTPPDPADQIASAIENQRAGIDEIRGRIVRTQAAVDIGNIDVVAAMAPESTELVYHVEDIVIFGHPSQHGIAHPYTHIGEIKKLEDGQIIAFSDFGGKKPQVLHAVAAVNQALTPR